MSQPTLNSPSTSYLYPVACVHGGLPSVAPPPAVIFDVMTNDADVGGHPHSPSAFAKKSRWSDACLDILRAEYPTPIAVRDIAAKVGRSNCGVYSKARRIGLRRPIRRGLATAPVEEVRAPVSSAVNATVANETPPPVPQSAPITYNGEVKPPPYVLTPACGRQNVWFPELTERMMRLWLANVQGTIIAAVFGSQAGCRDITPMAVQSKAARVGLPPRHGISLIRDIDVAREIDRQAAPLPKTICHQRKTLRLRMCPLSATPFYSENMNRLSNQAKKTKLYQTCNGLDDMMGIIL